MANQLIESIRAMMTKRGNNYDDQSGLRYYSGYGGWVDTWEIFFDAICLAYYGAEELAANGLRLLLTSIREDGFLPRMWRPVNEGNAFSSFEDEEHSKPFLCQAMLVVVKTCGHSTWFSRKDFIKLQKYLDYWLFTLDRDKNGLSEWRSCCF